MNKLPESIIDFHVHLFPDKLFDAIWRYFETAYAMTMPYKFYHQECIDYLNAHGVDWIVFSNYAHKKGVAESMNKWNLNLLERFPRLYCFAPYHPDDENALAYLDTMLSHPHVMGVKLHSFVQRIHCCDERLFPVYERLIERNKRLLVHAGTGPDANEYAGVDDFKKVLRRFPDLPVNIPHMGGLEFQNFMDLLDDHPRLYLDTAYSFWPDLPFTFNLDKNYLEKYKNRILYGSDFPNVILPREDEIAYLVKLDLSDAFYRNVFFENGKRLINETCPED